ncbi:MAG: single-stranded-DNA-specific exonuclease RecJ [Methylococcaceae bacterium]|nr:single-stranded-DNA-specific exonuclease RecJ [Methylococcaceae bacterium]MDP3020827.1 single-stranded-DNA-specific exonuclease RecJ [Methylococcaceae bacterium]MDP3391645.1 single-stranded-DNA-specific exonuclease RecJ [Methylococcaceae bacterium]MDP3932449.1 single-stranded-DNA-specific exonuclease RecJ [Methylococcaceae bacterium]MDZ4157777.1 single-stranded-DNA-specific exonuclease RecJ [Methylococcales bacterium]
MVYQGIKKLIVTRPIPKKRIQLSDVSPLLERIFLARGVTSAAELDRTLAKLPSPWLLSGMDVMVGHLVTAIKTRQKISIVADFDADGATSCAVAVKGLQLLGAGQVNFVVPNRFEYGYGLTPEIVALVKQQNPDVLITVDNGISSIDGVKVAKDLGIKVLITDHHLPGSELPAADAIVNPNLPDDKFPSGALAGVGVMFYVLMALRSRLREQGWFEQKQISEPNLAQLLDYVALGTVADVVPLDSVNRVLVYQGLQRIRSGRGHPGLNALIEVSGRNPQTIVASDLGFALGPRLNAAGRMDDMALGIQCLLTDDPGLAKDIAVQLDELNNDRREVEGQMSREAMALLADMNVLNEQHLPAGVCLYDANWHQGVIGILASRIKDRVHRPVIAFAPAGKDEIKGSARSIPGVHIRDVLSDVAAAHPKLLSKFGGHAMAAGMSLKMHDYPAFALAFDEVVKLKLADVDLEQKIYSDGELTEAELSLEFAELLQNAATWGQEFPEPVFDGIFDVIQSRIVGQRHLKLVLRKPTGNLVIDAIAFYVDQPENWLGLRQIRAAYRLDINEFRGNRSVQLMVQYLEKLA